MNNGKLVAAMMQSTGYGCIIATECLKFGIIC